jgi:replicative DNA helicase
VLANHRRGGLDWRLEELNSSLGPLRGGDFLIVTSRPDSGKTTFLCSESTFMAKQLPIEKDVFWANNEEVPLKVKQRIFQAALGMSKGDMEDDPMLTSKLLEDALGRTDRFKMYHDSAMTVRGVNNALTKCNPGLIIFDQLWKVDGFPGSHSEVDKMTKLFGWARSLAEKYDCPVVNVHQADGSASGEAYIQMHQMYNSKTGIQGEADAILGIGKSFDPSLSDNTRFLHISKNKLDGGKRSDPKQRNGKWEVEILPEIARFKGSL